MKIRVILIIALLILIAVGGLNDLMARKDTLQLKAHTWADEEKAPAENLMYRSCQNVFLFISFSRIPFVIYVNVLQAPDVGCQNPEKIPNKKEKNDGANKNFRRY